MDRQIELKLTARAVKLGNAGDGAALPELAGLLESTAAQVRRLAVSAIGKLAGLADASAAVQALQRMLGDAHPQVRQYAVKALSAYGAAAACARADLRDMAMKQAEKDYNRRDAQRALGVIEEAVRIAEAQAEHACQRCGRAVAADEYARSQRAFQRTFCDRCFDETYLKRRNFDTTVENHKTIRAADGTWVQSTGERRIAEWLSRQGLAYRYDERIRMLEGFAVRPDFYLPEYDLYIEYWGMDTIDYKIGMLMKLKLYQQTGKKLLSLAREDLPRMEAALAERLARHQKVENEEEGRGR